MEYMDLLPPTAPSLVFARETCTPYYRTLSVWRHLGNVRTLVLTTEKANHSKCCVLNALPIGRSEE